LFMALCYWRFYQGDFWLHLCNLSIICVTFYMCKRGTMFLPIVALITKAFLSFSCSLK
jgi:hypothetical protein